MEPSSPREDLLVAGLADWIHAGWVLNCADLSGETDPRVLRDVALDLIEEVLKDGIMRAGDLTDDGFVPDTRDLRDLVAAIREEWITSWGVKQPDPGAIIWLENTAEGSAFARSVLARPAR